MDRRKFLKSTGAVALLASPIVSGNPLLSKLEVPNSADCQRYFIHGSKIIDVERSPLPEIEVRELLDLRSQEFLESKLTVQQKIDVIHAVGFPVLKAELVKCYRQKGLGGWIEQEAGYNANWVADMALLLLQKIQNRQRLPVHSSVAEHFAIEEFMRKYFAAKAKIVSLDRERRRAFREWSYTTDYLEISRKRDEAQGWTFLENNYPSVVLSIRSNIKTTKILAQSRLFDRGLEGSFAVVITWEHSDWEHPHGIYLLQKSRLGWRIAAMGAKCNLCGISGRVVDKDGKEHTCSECDGAGGYF